MIIYPETGFYEASLTLVFLSFTKSCVFLRHYEKTHQYNQQKFCIQPRQETINPGRTRAFNSRCAYNDDSYWIYPEDANDSLKGFKKQWLIYLRRQSRGSF